MTVNRENIEKLSNYEVVNECADKYTNIDIEMVDSELDQAFKEAKLIKTWFWITMIMFIIELSIFCSLFICDRCCRVFSRGRQYNNDDDFHREDGSAIEMSDLKTNS